MVARHATPPPDFAAVLSMPFGMFGLRERDGLVHELVFLAPETPILPPATPLARQVAAELVAWLEDPDHCFDLPLAPRGTAFQRRVWSGIAAVPRGRQTTYGALARNLGSAPRAVGQACGANPFPLVIPCHRVVSAAGIGGFAGATDGHLLDAKRWLLDFETRR